MPLISRGFRGRRVDADPTRVPPGQYVTPDFPVLSAGPTPRTPLDRWSLRVEGLVREPVSWTWKEFLALPAIGAAANAPVSVDGLRTWTDDYSNLVSVLR